MGSIAVKNGSYLVNSSEAMKINPGVMVFTNDSVENKKEAIKAMYRAYDKAIEYLNSTPQEEYMDLVPEKSDWDKSINWLNKKELVTEKYNYEDIVSDILTK